ncbi:hypothetical protein HPB52_021592 [Rhipicephalus sanguineus]|uniref:HTH psq-type domain-containing protein n=1 Tax=Rhipicephalus sanguineus TaxID=34632 RepID=A0A9D4Q7N7_RHISA|nr:hypothetical protein HPB52_021592 [Rhipicephalus sanguineus]
MSRNRRPLTLGEKLCIIEEAEKWNGATKASIARDLNIPESSLKTILAKKDSILLNAAKFGLNRKAAKDGKYAAMEKALCRLAGMERKQLDKKLSVLDAMHCIASAWDAVTPETIANSFRHCGFNRSGACSTSEAAVPVDDELEFGSLELPGSFADYVGADDDVTVCSEVSLDDIIETVRPDTAGTSDEEEMDDAAEASASSEEVPSEQEEPIEGWELLDAGCTAEDFCTADDNLATCGARTVEDIVEEATCEVADSSDDGDNIDEGDGEGPPPAAETLHALDVLRRAMAADEISDDTCTRFYGFQRSLLSDFAKKKKQKDI